MSDNIDRLVDRDHIAALLAIADARSFSGAASALGVSQPSISQQVKRIEALVGRRLFRRTRFGVELTSDGEAILVYARAMRALTEDLKRHLDETTGPARIRIGMSEDVCRTALPTVLWLFMRDHPAVEVRIVSGAYDMLMSAIETQAVDLAVMRRYPQLAEATTLWTDELTWRGRADLRFPIEDPVPLALPIAPNPAREALFAALESTGRTWRVAFESASLANGEAALQAGFGVSAAPHGMRLFGVARLDARSGLPPLPHVDFVMVEPAPSAGGAILAFAEVLRKAAKSRFRLPSRAPPGPMDPDRAGWRRAHPPP